MRLLLTALVIGAGAGWVAGGAVAAVVPAPAGTLVAAPRFVPVAGPVIAGPERLAWVRRRGDAVLDLWVSEPGRGPRFVQRFSGSDSERLRAPRLSASVDSLSLRFRVTDRRDATLRTLSYAGAFGEPLAPGPAIATQPASELWPGHAAIVTRACASAEIRTIALAAPTVAAASHSRRAASEPACELRLRGPLRLRGDRLRLGVSCAGFRIDCSARVTVRARGHVIARGTARYNHATPPYAAATLPVTARGRRLLRAGVRMRVTARLTDPSLAYAVTRETTRQLPAARR